MQDDYEIIKKVGQGKYSEVFQGFNVVKHESIIIKVLKPIVLKKIKREVLVLSNLDHPNIIKLYDLVQDQGSLNYSLIFPEMPFIPLKQNYHLLTLEKIKFIIREILLALDHAHSRGIFHRDIKPQNILTDFKSIAT